MKALQFLCGWLLSEASSFSGPGNGFSEFCGPTVFHLGTPQALKSGLCKIDQTSERMEEYGHGESSS
jgi:hypothetical protein